MSRISRRNFLAASAAAGVGVVGGAAEAGAAPGAGVLPVRPLGLTGLMPTVIGFGSGSQFMAVQDEATAERMIHRAVELGIRYFDTAYSYGRDLGSVKRFGRYLVPSHREAVLIATKTGARDAETAKRQIDEMLSLLGTDRVDVLHMHDIKSTADVDRLVAADGALAVFRSLKEQGAIRAIGVSGHTDSKVMVDAMRRIQPDCIMTPQNPGHGSGLGQAGASFTADVIPYALRHGIGLLGMKVTGQNALTGKGGMSAHDLVRYIVSQPVAAAVIGMGAPEVVESSAEIARNLTPMTPAEMEAARTRILAAVDMRTAMPYLQEGYVDGSMA